MAAGSNNIVTDGLISCWDPANRRSYPGTGTVLTDLVGGNNAELTNMGNAGSGFFSEKGGIIAFDGSNDSLELNDDLEILPHGTNPFTINMWVRPESGIGNYPYLAEFAQHDALDKSFIFTWFNTGSYSFYIGQRSLAIIVPDDIADADLDDFLDKWVNVCLTYNGGAKGNHTSYRLYLDAVSITLDSFSDVGGASNFNTIGSDTGTSSTWKGDMALISIYNRALSADEVSQNYEALKPRFVPRITKSGMFASWDAGDPASYPGGTTLKDTANNYDGTFVNNGSGADISFDSANGGSLVFDGSDDYVNITTLPDYSGTARSAIIWFSVDDMDGGIYTPFQSATDQFCVSFGHYELSGTVYAAFRSKNSGSNYTYGVSTTVSDGVWTCWAVTIDASDEIVAVYQNGDSKSLAAGHGFTIKTGTTIGCRLDGSTVQNDLDGKVGSLRLYTKTLSAAEVMDNFQKTRGRFGV